MDNTIVPFTSDWYFGGAALLGNKIWVKKLSSAGLVRWVYCLQININEFKTNNDFQMYVINHFSKQCDVNSNATGTNWRREWGCIFKRKEFKKLKENDKRMMKIFEAFLKKYNMEKKIGIKARRQEN